MREVLKGRTRLGPIVFFYFIDSLYRRLIGLGTPSLTRGHQPQVSNLHRSNSAVVRDFVKMSAFCSFVSIGVMDVVRRLDIRIPVPVAVHGDQSNVLL